MSDAASYAGIRVTLLGATGFVGQWVARALRARGATLHLIARDPVRLGELRRANALDASASVGDLSDAKAVRTLIAGARPAVIFNLAGYGVDPDERDPALASALNETLPPLLASLMHEQGDGAWTGQQVVHVGSALEYGTATGDLRESTIGIPTTVYGTTKLAGTMQLHERASSSGVRAVTARLFTVYGRGEHDGRLLPSLIAAARTDDAIPLTDGLQRRDFTYVEDVVEGLLRLGALGASDVGPVNIATSRLTTVRKFVETAAGVLGIAEGRLHFGALPTRHEEMHHDPVSVDRLRALTAWLPSIPIAQGIALAARG